MKCAICGDDITGRDKRLADGSKVCLDCYMSSASIVTCSECGNEMLAANAAKDQGDMYCMDCFRGLVQGSGCIGEAWEDWKAERDEEGEDSSIDEWAQYLNEYFSTMQEEYKDTRIFVKTAREEIAKMVEAARNAA